ncbi:MAG: hypothetical protein WA418_20770 [Bradyrhizobium sp.]
MDILEFIQRSEWPVVAIMAIAVFRRPLTRLIERVRPTKLSAWGVSVELDEVEALTAETRAIAKDEAPKQADKPLRDLLVFQPAEYDHPQLVILKAWTALENAIYRAAGKDGPTPGVPSWIPMRVMEAASKKLGLTSNELLAIRELRNVRNRVADEIDFPVTRADAIRFVELSRDLIVRIDMARKSGGSVAN